MGDDPQSNKDNTPLDYADTSYDSPPVILCRIPLVEAELARAKLESEGIECFVRDANTAINSPFVVSEVPLLVKKSDVEYAREVLARPAEDDAEGEYVDEAWRCPHCHRKTIDLMPPSLGRRQLRVFWLALWIVPILSTVVAPRGIESAMKAVGDWVFPAWLMTVVVLGVVVFTGQRAKRCRECGHEWIAGKSGESTSD